MRRHPGGGAVDDAFGPGHRGRQVRPDLDPVGAEDGSHPVSQLLGPLGEEVVQDERVGSVVQQGVGDCGSRSPGPDLHDGAVADVGQLGLERSLETAPVGVVTDGPPVPDRDGVDGAEGRGPVGELIQVGDDRLLERVGDVEPTTAQTLGPGEHVGQVSGGEPQFESVDDPVADRHTERSPLALVQRGGP